MKLKNKIKIFIKRTMAMMIMISIIFTSFGLNTGSVIYATQTSQSIDYNQIHDEIEQWLKDNHKNEIFYYEYKENNYDQELYAAKMPKTDGNIIYNGVNGTYVYNIEDTSTGAIIKQIEFNVELLINEGGGLPVITEDNYKNYTSASSIATIETKDGTLLKTVDLDSKESQISMAYAIKIDGCDLITTDSANVQDIKNGQSLGQQFWDWFVNANLVLLDLANRPIAIIINNLLLGIADGIKDLLDGIFGEEVTIYKIIFGKIDKMTINYWEVADSVSEESNTSNSEDNNTTNSTNGNSNTNNGEEDEELTGTIAITLMGIVSYWYGVFRGIVIAVYLVMLLYIGIRILLSSTGKAGQKYKDMLTSWVVGIVILTFFPYVMRYTVVLNDLLVTMMDPNLVEITETGEVIQKEDTTYDMMNDFREEAGRDVDLALTLIYIILLGQLIVLIGVYYKRVFTIAFLIAIFPITAGIYIWEKSKGNASSLTTWMKEYVILVFIQTFHAVIYVVFIDGAYIVYKQSNNWIMFMISVLFLFEAEKIIRTIFGMKSSANTIGDLATAGAAALTASGKLKDVIKGGKKAKSEDDKNADEAEEKVKEAKKNTTVNKMLERNRSAQDDLSYGLESEPADEATREAIGESGVGGSDMLGGVDGDGGVDTNSDEEGQPNDFEAAQALVTEGAFRNRTKRGVIGKALNVTGRAAGITLGATSGMAMGSGKDALANAAIGNEIGGIVAKGPIMITGWAKGLFEGKVMRRKIEKGEMDDALRQVGFDLSKNFDQDAAVSEAKARVYRKALAVQAEVTRRKGAAAGQLAYIDIIEEERKKEGF